MREKVIVMSGMVGMDVAGVRQLSKLMLSKADEIESAAKQVQKQVNSVKWVGADANRYRDDWNTTQMNNVRQVTEALRRAGKQAAKDADEQEKASS